MKGGREKEIPKDVSLFLMVDTNSSGLQILFTFFFFKSLNCSYM